MNYIDLYLTSSEMKEKIEMAKRIGISSLGFTVSSNGDIQDFLERVNSIESDIDIVKCLMIDADGPRQMKNIVSKNREKFDVIMVFGGDYSINRAAAEDSRVDILMHPEFRRKDSGIDHIIAKAAADNGVAIGISIHSLLTSYKKIRAQILAHHRNNLMLCEKYNTHVVLTSGAMSKWDMRDMREISAIANTLGYPIDKAVSSVTLIPEIMIEANRKKLSGKIVSSGVEIVG